MMTGNFLGYSGNLKLITLMYW